MKNNWKLILIIAAALAVGILIGVLAAGGNGNGDTPGIAEHDHEDGTIWTCSMHPQIRQNEPGDCPICGMDLIPLEKGEEDNPLLLTMTPSAVQLAGIETTVAGTAPGQKKISLTGQIAVDETKVQIQTAHFPGRIEQLKINYEGQKVNRGERIATLYSPELISAQRELLEAYKTRESNPALFQAAKQKLENWKLSSTQVQQILQKGEVATAFPVYADVDGSVSEIMVEAGDHLQSGDVLFKVANLGDLWAVFNAYENDLAWIEEGDKVQFTVPSLPGRKFSATVAFVDPFVNQQTRVVEIRATVDNPERTLKPEMFIRGEITAARPQEGEQMTIPKSAVMWTGKRSVVYVQIPGKEVPTFGLREVTLGPRMNDAYIVEEGLEPGDEVVVNGTFTIDAAAQLQNKPSMMNPKIAVKGQAEGGEITAGVPSYSDQTPAAFKDQIQDLLKDYLALKDKLVDSDKDGAADAAKALQNRLNSTDMTLLKNDPHDYWMQQLDDMKTHINNIINAPSIGVQRKYFVFVSNLMIDNLKAFGVNKGTYYLQFCPMANEDKGAYWLSANEEIRNPYYGEEMLTCGSVREEIGSGDLD